MKSHLNTFNTSSLNNYQQKQFIGQQQPFNQIQQQDIITSLQFDNTGQFIAIGDNAGRVILFKQQQQQSISGQIIQNYQYYSEFISHNQEFDTLKSINMSESIKMIKWLRSQGKYHKMLTSNSHRIKLWKMYEKQEKKMVLASQRLPLCSSKYLASSKTFKNIKTHDELAMPTKQKENQTVFTSVPQIIFPIKHESVINNVEAVHNQEYLFSTDQSRALLWNFQKTSNPFILEDITNKNYWKESETISCSKIHPISESIFLCGTNKGTIQLSDMRAAWNNRKNISFLANKNLGNTHNFTEMTKKINSLVFIQSGKYIVSRDYLTVKIWDVVWPNTPIKVIQTNSSLQNHLSYLFQQQCLGDQFSISPTHDNTVITGNYDNRFNCINPLAGDNIEYKMSFIAGQCKKTQLNLEQSIFSYDFDLNRKIQKTSAHKNSNKIALASLNSFFVYQREKY